MKNHLKRISAPKNWDIARKTTKYVVKPNPGMHSSGFGVALSFAMRDQLKLARTKKEVKYILQHQEVLVDGKKRKDEKFNVGFMDVISIPLTKQSFRGVFNKKGRVDFKEIPEKEATQKIVRIINKTPKGKKFQLNLADGRNLLIEKADYKVNDSVLIELPSQKIIQHFPLEKGASIILIGGKHLGSIGHIESIEGDKLVFKTEKTMYETNKKYAFVVGKDKPAIVVQ